MLSFDNLCLPNKGMYILSFEINRNSQDVHINPEILKKLFCSLSDIGVDKEILSDQIPKYNVPDRLYLIFYEKNVSISIHHDISTQKEILMHLLYLAEYFQ